MQTDSESYIELPTRNDILRCKISTDNLDKKWLSLRNALHNLSYTPLLCVDLPRLIENFMEHYRHPHCSGFNPAELFSELHEFERATSEDKNTTEDQVEHEAEDEIIARGERLNLKARNAALANSDDLYIEKGEWDECIEEPGPALSDVMHDLQSLDYDLVLFPIKESWKIPALLRFGGWNACPGASSHVAQLKSWNERFGAEPVAMTPDKLWLYIERPITSRKMALIVAKEQFYYCPDLAGEDQTLCEIASQLLHAQAWFFWWD